jgi:hypothetical protein
VSDFDTIPVRLPSGSKAIVQLPRVFTLEDGVHLMDFLTAYLTDKTGEPVALSLQQGAAEAQGEKQ